MVALGHHTSLLLPAGEKRESEYVIIKRVRKNNGNERASAFTHDEWGRLHRVHWRPNGHVHGTIKNPLPLRTRNAIGRTSFASPLWLCIGRKSQSLLSLPCNNRDRAENLPSKVLLTIVLSRTHTMLSGAADNIWKQMMRRKLNTSLSFFVSHCSQCRAIYTRRRRVSRAHTLSTSRLVSRRGGPLH